MFGEKRYLPSPYDYPSADDYYEAVDEYYKWLEAKEEAEAEEIGRAHV